MKLQETLPNNAFLVEVTDASGQRHRNFVGENIDAINTSIPLLIHVEEFLPKNLPQLRKRLLSFVGKFAVGNPDGSPVGEEQKTEIAGQIYEHFLGLLAQNKDIIITRDRDSGAIQSIQIKPPLKAIEEAYRSVLPHMAERCGLLFATETGGTPQIVITDHQDLSTLLPPEWPESKAAGFAYKIDGRNASPECDNIFITHQTKGLYEYFLQNEQAKHMQGAKNANFPLPVILIAPTLGHELCHHLGLDTIAAKHDNALNTAIQADAKHCREIHDLAKSIQQALQGSADNLLIVHTLKQSGLLGRHLPLLQEAVKITEHEKGSAVGKSLPLRDLEARYAELKPEDRRQLKKYVENIVHMTAFGANRADYTEDAKTTYAQIGQNIADEILPQILSVQCLLGEKAARLIYPHSYTAVDDILKKEQIDITQSVQLSNTPHKQ